MSLSKLLRYVQFMKVNALIGRLRKSTYENLKAMQNGLLKKKLQESLSKDPIAPILDNAWYPALERRLKIVLQVMDRCLVANGPEAVLVEDES